MADFKSSDDPPAYSDAYSGEQFTLKEKFAQAQNDVGAVRSARIQTLINDYVLSHLEHQAANGFAESQLTFLPSDVKDFDLGYVSENDGAAMDGTLGKNVPGSRNMLLGGVGNYTRIHKLSGPEDTSDFWMDPAVMRKLQAAIRERLGIEDDTGKLLQQVGKKKQPFWKRVVAVSSNTGPTTNKKESSVKVKCQEVSQSVKGKMELWEVQNAFALVIEVHMGS